MEEKVGRELLERCEHLWMPLGISYFNRKRYRRCVKCGLIKGGRVKT
jgi:hypothetical protein